MCNGWANGGKATVGKGCTAIEPIWDFFSQIYQYMYTDFAGKPRIRYGTEVESTRAHLRTATRLGVKQVGFWVFACNGGIGGTEKCDVFDPMVEATMNWTLGRL